MFNSNRIERRLHERSWNAVHIASDAEACIVSARGIIEGILTDERFEEMDVLPILARMWLDEYGRSSDQ